MAQTNASATYSQNISALCAWLHTNTAMDVQTNAPLSDHCTFHIGGPADLLLTPSTTEQLLTLLRQSAYPFRAVCDHRQWVQCII